jgi:acyl carrier protein
VEIKTEVRKYIAENFLSGSRKTTIEDTTPLITGGLIDSIGMVGLVAFIERCFEIEFMPREIDVDRMDTLERIETLIKNKLANSGAGAGH